MEDKVFIWPEELTLKMLELKFKYDKIFKSKKQPWSAFYNILLKHEFPREVTKRQVTKKWGYLWDMYKLAKRENNTSWKYYEMFDNHYGKTQELGKYDSWSNEWRLKLITCIAATKEHNMDQKTMWRTVERAMRSQDMPEDCCVQDLQGLWHHLRMTFVRKHRITIKRGTKISEWPLYSVMLDYYKEHENLATLSGEDQSYIKRRNNKNSGGRNVDGNDNEHEFTWSKDITESFIQLRLQNDWLFNERSQAWKHFVAILKEEYGFPPHLNRREASRKWASTYREYQKSKATKNTSWLYYNLFEAYLGEGALSINPLFDWQETWALKLIEARTTLEHDWFLHKLDRRMFPNERWREVEKRLRHDGIPLDHSLMDLHNIWIYLVKTYKWKKKYADKGVLKEQWPYFDAMTKYMEIHEKNKAEMQNTRFSKPMKYVKTSNDVAVEFDDGYDDDDDIKLFDLKQKMELKDSKPQDELSLGGKQCRACANVAPCVDIFEKNIDDVTIASMLALVGGIQVEKSDNLPPQLCYNCLQELENAYKFRRRCQEVDKQFRDSNKIKIEIFEKLDENLGDELHYENDVTNDDMTGIHDTTLHYTSLSNITETSNANMDSKSIKKFKKDKAKQKTGKRRYDYWRVCEICGKHTKNLKSHIDTHNMEKPYSCDVCGRKFKFKSGLVIHRGIHNAVPRKACEICGKTFHIMAHFRRHFAIHANERKFACDTCGQRFNSLDILRVHIRIHTGERPFDCSECGKAFRTAGCVSRHKRIVHRIIRKV